VAKYNLKAIHVKILLTTLIFCVFSGFYEAVTPTLPLFLYDLGYASLEIGFITSILSIIVFILDSALLFVILYLICRRNFMKDIAGIVISIIIGTIVGYWIGGLLGLSVSSSSFPRSPSLFTVSILLSEFGACAAAYLNIKWEQLTPRREMVSERPFGVVLISALYIVLSLSLTVLTLVVFGLSSIGFEALFKKILLFTLIIALLSILSIAYFFIAYGFYRGRRWAWFTVFAFTLMGILLSVNQLILIFNFDILFILRIVVLLLDTFILIYLIQPYVRIYFGIINPISES
jgi:hypothetical protein